MKSLFAKNQICVLYVTLVFFAVLSCSKDNEKSDTEKEPTTIIDTYNYIGLTATGGAQLYQIGNNSGTIEKYVRIPNLDFNMISNSVTVSESNIYIYQQLYDNHMGKIFVYQKTTKATKSFTLDLTSDSFGDFPVIVGLDWDEMSKSLIGIVKSNYLDINSVNSIARINTETFEVENLGIEFFQKNISSSFLKGSNLYISSFSNEEDNDFNSIDISTKTLKKLAFDSSSDLFSLSIDKPNNKVFAFSPLNLPGYRCSGPVIIELDYFSVQPIITEDILCTPFGQGKGYYNTVLKEHIAIVNLSAKTQNPNALLRYNSATGKVVLTEMKDVEGDSNALIIIDAIKI